MRFYYVSKTNNRAINIKQSSRKNPPHQHHNPLGPRQIIKIFPNKVWDLETQREQKGYRSSRLQQNRGED